MVRSFRFSTVADDSDQVEEHSSVKQLKLTSEQGIAVTLEECFKVGSRVFNVRLNRNAFFLRPEYRMECPV